MKKKSKKKKKLSYSKLRILIGFILFCIVSSFLVYNCFSNIRMIGNMKEEKKALEEKIIKLQEEKEILEGNLLKLEDPEYIAKYVREKYYFSKNGELILKMD